MHTLVDLKNAFLNGEDDAYKIGMRGTILHVLGRM